MRATRPRRLARGRNWARPLGMSPAFRLLADALGGCRGRWLLCPGFPGLQAAVQGPGPRGRPTSTLAPCRPVLSRGLPHPLHVPSRGILCLTLLSALLLAVYENTGRKKGSQEVVERSGVAGGRAVRNNVRHAASREGRGPGGPKALGVPLPAEPRPGVPWPPGASHGLPPGDRPARFQVPLVTLWDPRLPRLAPCSCPHLTWGSLPSEAPAMVLGSSGSSGSTPRPRPMTRSLNDAIRGSLHSVRPFGLYRVTSAHITCRPFSSIPLRSRSLFAFSEGFISLPLITTFGILVFLAFFFSSPHRSSFYLLPLHYLLFRCVARSQP